MAEAVKMNQNNKLSDEPFRIVFKMPGDRVSVFRLYTVKDPETGHWTAFSNEIPGLVTEAADYNELLDKAKSAAEELIELNHVHHFENVELIPMELTIQEAENVGLL